MSSLARHRWLLALVLLGAAAVYLIGNDRVGLWDRDEPRYAQCSRQMLQSGDWVVPRFLDGWRTEKPPMIYWCQATVMAVIGDTAQAARFPSVLATLGSAIVLAWIVRKYAGARRAIWSVFIFCTAGLVIAAAKMCITDALLALFVIIGQACMGIMYASNRRGRPVSIWIVVIFWISLGLAGLTKGPQALGFHAVTMLVLLGMDVGRQYRSKPAWKKSIRWWRELRPWIGVPILLVIIAPWLIRIHKEAPGFVEELFHKAKLHSATSMEGHGRPPGYHFLLIFGTFFPWSLVLLIVMKKAYANRHLPQVKFAIAATCGPWLLMEAVTTKLPFYILPAFPGLAFLTADTLVRCMRGQYRDLVRKDFGFAIGIWAFAALGICLGPWYLARMTSNLPFLGMTAFSVCGIIYVGLILRLYARRQVRWMVMTFGIGMLVMIAILFGTILPNIPGLRISERLADDLKAHGGVGSNVPLAMIDYKEPSLAFYQGGGAREQPDNYLLITPPDQWPQWIVISQAFWQKVPPARQALLEIVATEDGFAYSAPGTGKSAASILILRKK